MSVTNEPRTLRLVSQNSLKELRKRYNYMHLGLIVIGIKGLTRSGLGTKVLLTLLDKRWNDINKAIIANIEVDMNDNRGIFYCSPNIPLIVF